MDYQDLVEAIRHYKVELYELGKDLAYAKEHYPEMIGEGGVDTWSDFVSQPEIGLTTREANALIRLSEWVDGIGVPLRDLNLSTAKYGASRGISDPDLVEDMKVLSTKDFKDRHYDHTTEEKGERTYTYMVMRRCNETNNLNKVHGVESEEVLEKFKDKIDE